jgi:branched-chain amino acid aminotransferase
MPEEMHKATEMFLTGSAAEITPVGAIDGAIGQYRFTPGAICQLMIDEYDVVTGKHVKAAAAE